MTCLACPGGSQAPLCWAPVSARQTTLKVWLQVDDLLTKCWIFLFTNWGTWIYNTADKIGIYNLICRRDRSWLNYNSLVENMRPSHKLWSRIHSVVARQVWLQWDFICLTHLMTPGLAGCVGGVLAGSSVYVLLFSPEGLSQSSNRIGGAGKHVERKKRNQPVVKLSKAQPQWHLQ